MRLIRRIIRKERHSGVQVSLPVNRAKCWPRRPCINPPSLWLKLIPAEPIPCAVPGLTSVTAVLMPTRISANIILNDQTIQLQTGMVAAWCTCPDHLAGYHKTQNRYLPCLGKTVDLGGRRIIRSEEHTSELQSH